MVFGLHIPSIHNQTVNMFENVCDGVLENVGNNSAGVWRGSNIFLHELCE